MKKLLALTLAGAMLFALTGCYGNDTSSSGGDMQSMGYKVGMASYTTNEKSYGYTTDKNAGGVISTTYVTCVFDEKGQIVKAYIDEVESKTYFDQMGQLADYTKGEVRSKRELGDEYGMRAASGIGKEWYEQIDALEKYLVGKDVNVITGAVNGRTNDTSSDYTTNSSSYVDDSNTMGESVTSMMEGVASNIMNGAESMMDDMTDGYTEDGTTDYGTDYGATWMTDLTASVTIDTTNIQRAIQKAYKNAK